MMYTNQISSNVDFHLNHNIYKRTNVLQYNILMLTNEIRDTRFNLFCCLRFENTLKSIDRPHFDVT